MSRTEKLAAMKAKHRERVAEIRADGDLTHEAKERRIQELGTKHHAEIRAEEERVTEADRLYRRYRLAADAVEADLDMAPEEKAAAVTRLTDDLYATEAELGIVWHPVASVTVEATGDGSVELDLPGHEERKNA